MPIKRYKPEQIVTMLRQMHEGDYTATMSWPPICIRSPDSTSGCSQHCQTQALGRRRKRCGAILRDNHGQTA